MIVQFIQDRYAGAFYRMKNAQAIGAAVPVENHQIYAFQETGLEVVLQNQLPPDSFFLL